jgi:hypothetical protein
LRAPERSRLAAQARIVAARKGASIAVRVYSPDGNLSIEKAVGGFLGRLDSRIMYDVGIDRSHGDSTGSEARDEWLATAEDLCLGNSVGYAQSQDVISRPCGHHAGERLWNPMSAVDLFRSRTY